MLVKHWANVSTQNNWKSCDLQEVKFTFEYRNVPNETPYHSAEPVQGYDVWVRKLHGINHCILATTVKDTAYNHPQISACFFVNKRMSVLLYCLRKQQRADKYKPPCSIANLNNSKIQLFHHTRCNSNWCNCKTNKNCNKNRFHVRTWGQRRFFFLSSRTHSHN